MFQLPLHLFFSSLIIICIRFPRSSSLCWLRRTDLQEFGVYNLTLQANGTCAFAVDKPGVPINYG